MRIGLKTFKQKIYHHNKDSFAWFVSDGVLKKQDYGYVATRGIMSRVLHGQEATPKDLVWTSKLHDMFFFHYGFIFLSIPTFIIQFHVVETCSS